MLIYRVPIYIIGISYHHRIVPCNRFPRVRIPLTCASFRRPVRQTDRLAEHRKEEAVIKRGRGLVGRFRYGSVRWTINVWGSSS